MSKRLRPSPAVLVAALALMAAATGTALAGPGASASRKHGARHGDARQDARQFGGLLKGAARKLSVAHATGADHASSADAAATVAGVTVKPFLAQAPAGTINKPIATVGLLTLVASCNGSSKPSIGFKAAEDVNHLDYVDGGGVSGSGQLAPNTVDNMSGTPTNGAMGEMQGVSYISKKSIKVDWFIRPGPNSLGTATGCLFSGYVNID